MSTKELIFEGKEKRIFATDDPGVVLIHYKDVATAFGGIKQAVLKDKGIYCNKISSMVFERLEAGGVRTHYVGIYGDREQLCRKVGLIPLQIIVRNRLAGTTARMLGVERGTAIPNVVFELRYNNDALQDPLINDHHAVALGIVSYAELGHIYDLARRTNDILTQFYHEAGIELVDFKMECGRTEDGDIIVSDEISPDNSRLWDESDGRVLDKDRFRHDMSDVTVSYKEVMERLEKVSAK